MAPRNQRQYQASSAGNNLIFNVTKQFVLAYHRLGTTRVFGLENFPQTGRVILAPNHVSHLDPPILSIYSPRRPHVIAKSELFVNPFLNKWFRGLGAFPIVRGKADRKAIRHAVSLLEAEEAVLIFPEGTRSTTGVLGDAEIGLGMIAHSTKSPILPMFVRGTEQAFSPVRPGFRRVHVEIHFGKPLLFVAEYSRRGDRATLESIGAQTMAAIAALRDGSQ